MKRHFMICVDYRGYEASLKIRGDQEGICCVVAELPDRRIKP